MKVKRLSNFHVVVTAAEPYWPPTGQTPEQYQKAEMRRCEDIRKEITRHVDGIASANIVYASDDVCSFCECRWDDSMGYPACCTKALAEYEETEKSVLPT